MRRNQVLINKDKSLLIIIDVQEKLNPVMESPRAVLNGCVKLINVAQTLNIPIIITEQYPKGLGPTMVDIKNATQDKTVFVSKTSFSCAKDPKIMKLIEASHKKHIILAGIETHICVLQTAIDLKEKGFEVFVVSDASGSGDAGQNYLGIQRLLQNQIDVVSTQMVAFEWLEDSTHEKFKEISKNYI